MLTHIMYKLSNNQIISRYKVLHTLEVFELPLSHIYEICIVRALRGVVFLTIKVIWFWIILCYAHIK